MITEILVNKMMVHFERNIEMDETKRDTIKYGLGALVYTILSTSLLLLIGMHTGSLKSAFILIICFYINQTIGGGYHAKTHLRCFFTMAIGTIVGIYIINAKELSSILFCFCGISGSIFLFTFPLVLNQNKKYLEYNVKQLILRSRVSTACETLVLLAIYILNLTLFKSLSIAIMLSGVSRVVGFIKSRNHTTQTNF